MSTPSTRRGNLLAVAFLLLLAILFEQYGIAPFFPWTNAAGSLRPMIVFLDIPLSLPDIDWLPVSILFTILYCVAIGPRISRAGHRVGHAAWKALTGWWILLTGIAAAGGIYYLLQDVLPKQVNNGIDSFGIRTDLTLPWPSSEIIHLHGSMLMLLFALLGGCLMARRTAITITRQPADAPGIPAAGSTAVAEAQAIINSPIPPVKRKESITKPARKPASEPVLAGEPEPPAARSSSKHRPSISVTMPSHPHAPAFPGQPPTCRLTTPPPIAVVMPRPAPGIGRVYPCIIIGSLIPAKR